MRGGCTTTCGWNATACWCRWAVPEGPAETTSVNQLAVHTEDHPLEYLTFHGAIPKGEYGGGEMIVWDSGTYETEKFRDKRRRMRSGAKSSSPCTASGSTAATP